MRFPATILPVFLATMLATMMVSGCEEVRPGHTATELERDAAYDLVSQLTAIAAQPVDATGILQAANFAPIVTLVAPAGIPMAMPDNRVSDGDTSDCLLATGTSVTYSQCELADHVVDGTSSAHLDRVHAELVDVFVVAPGVHGSIAVEANLAASAEISGQLEAGLMWSVGDSDYVLDATIRIDGLVIEGPRCATSGTITITGGLSEAPATTTTLWFGPGCQDVQISP